MAFPPDLIDRQASHPSPIGARPPGIHTRHRRRFRRLAWALALVLVPLLGLGGWSAVGTLSMPGHDPLSVRWVEWVRGHGGGGVVRLAEQVWYSHHQPPTKGQPAPGLIKPAPAVVAKPVRQGHLPAPAPVSPPLSPSLPGEGIWQPTGRLVQGIPAIFSTTWRPDPAHPSVVAAVAWMDPTLLSAQLFAGASEPGGSGWTYSSPIPPNMRPSLVAAFNSGFRLQDSQGGYYSEGRTVKPLIPGTASLVIDKNGTATVGQWGRDISMSANVSSVRQNLYLIVDNSAVVPGLANGTIKRWGATLNNKLYVWRSGVGVTANGALVYAAGPNLSITTLADTLARAGAVRAMELDINTDWVNFFSFDPSPGQPAGPTNASKLLTGMVRPLDRYFLTDSRDFIGLFARNSSGPSPLMPASAGGSAP
ncbi:MAG: phosphodiester glycosidase family protein [Acidimicrobiales bacterium]